MAEWFATIAAKVAPPADTAQVRPALAVLQAAGAPTSRTVLVYSGQESVWENGNYVTRNRMVPATIALLPYVKRSPATGEWIPDLRKYRAPPPGYPHPDDPTIPLDDMLPPVKAGKRYGGLAAGGSGPWDWLAWRKLTIWNTGRSPSGQYEKIAEGLLSEKERRYFSADAEHSQSGFSKVVGKIAGAPLEITAKVDRAIVKAAGGSDTVFGSAVETLTKTADLASVVGSKAYEQGLDAALREAPADIVAGPYKEANDTIARVADAVGAEHMAWAFDKSGDKVYEAAIENPAAAAMVGAAAVGAGFALAAAAPAGGFFGATGGAEAGAAGAGGAGAAGGAGGGGSALVTTAPSLETMAGSGSMVGAGAGGGGGIAAGAGGAGAAGAGGISLAGAAKAGAGLALPLIKKVLGPKPITTTATRVPTTVAGPDLLTRFLRFLFPPIGA